MTYLRYMNSGDSDCARERDLFALDAASFLMDMSAAATKRTAAGTLFNRRRLRRGELVQLEFPVVVEEPVFHQLQMATRVEKGRRRRWQG